MFLRRKTLPARYLTNNLSRRTSEQSCPALAGTQDRCEEDPVQSTQKSSDSE